MRSTSALLVILLLVAACGGGDTGGEGDNDPDRPVLQIHWEGGFAPLESIYGRGPIYTLLGDGRLIYEGPVIAIYPGPLLPNYQVTRLDLDQVGEILDLVEEIGLPRMTEEVDDSASAQVADATTEVLTYWDESGVHRYAVYALGLGRESSNPATAAAAELFEVVGRHAHSGESVEYAGDRVRIIAGVSQLDPEPGFEDVRPWPLDGEDPSTWQELDLGFSCKVLGPEVLDTFADATQVTRWDLPTRPGSDYVLLVRPLHPGEPDCPGPAGD